MKGFRFYLILILLAASVFLILSPMVFRKSGVVVTSVRTDSCGDISEGDIITQISGTVIHNSQEFDNFVNGVEEGNYYAMVVNSGPGGCTALSDGDIGIDVADIESSGLRFERAIGGGVEITLEPGGVLSNSELQETVDIIQSRMSILGISDGSVGIQDGKIIISASPNKNLGLLTKRGSIEAVIKQGIEVKNGSGEVKIGNSRYPIEFLGNTITVNGSEVGVNGEFYLENVKLIFVNGTNTSIVLNSVIFDNDNIISKIEGAGGVSFETSVGQYMSRTYVYIDEESGEKFEKVSNGLSTVLLGQSTTLNGVWEFYVDGRKINDIAIPVSVEQAGESIETAFIMGFGESVDEVATKGKIVEVALTGELPTDFNIEDTVTTQATNGWVLWSVPSVIIILSIVSFISFRKNSKVAIAIAAMIVLESVYLFGVFTAIQQFTSWIIDVYSLIGVCVFLIINTLDVSVLAKDSRRSNLMRKVWMVVFLVGFATLFTPFRGLGISITFGVLADRILTRPFFKSFLKTV
jgi:hypothetical protein